MSRVTNLRKKRLQHKLDRERHKEKSALKRRRHPKPVSKSEDNMTPKRQAARRKIGW